MTADTSSTQGAGRGYGSGPARPAFYTPEQIAAALQIGTRALFRLEADGEFPKAMRLTRKIIRYDVRTVDSWLYDRGFTGEVLAA